MTTSEVTDTQPAPKTDAAPAVSEAPTPVSEQADAPKPAPAVAKVPFRTKVKHGLLKVIDITALGFLEPVVRLCYGEEPRVQLVKIGRFVAVPILAFLVFLGLWGWLAPMHKTKSGEVPKPSVVYAAGMDSLQMHEWENAKAEGYTLLGSEREAELERALARQAEVEQLLVTTREDLETARAARADEIGAELEALDTTYNELRSEQRSYRRSGLTELNEHAETLAVDDTAGRAELLDRIAAYQDKDKAARTAWQDARDTRDELANDASPEIKALSDSITSLADEQLFLNSLVDALGEGSREVRVANIEAEIVELEALMATATGKDLVKAGIDLIAARDSLDQAKESDKAKAYTLPYQIQRSIACVFIGFLVGCAIAIPLGVMCGLSSTFMAAMTPFIALFKPVSPIIWLLIALIITGGFIPDPDDHWLINLLDDFALTSWIEVNPGFIASAATVAMCSLWATLVNTALGVASVDKDHMNVARVLKLRFHQRLTKIILPSALPLVFAGMRISLGVGWMVLIAAELLANSQGIGVYVWDAYNSGSSDSFAMMFVAVFVVGFIGLILDRIMIIFQRLASFEGGVAAV